MGIIKFEKIMAQINKNIQDTKWLSTMWDRV